MSKPYHHGALRSALIDAGVDLARHGGPGRVVLREVARTAQVSHSAAYRHFTDREALLAEVACRARAELAAEMSLRLRNAREPRERLHAVGSAYIDFARGQPGLFRTAFGAHATPAEGTDSGAEPFAILGGVLDELHAVGLLSAERRPGAELAAWSAVHGLACLLLDGPLAADPNGAKFAIGRVHELIERGLLD
ncbi:TetR/AcrR family transcriptional regulator [Nocardia jejuensis]|uniref:TetR/AcrR family transcriptional regulator n=1 Tax=Nocardia jejuensis TaxID=328049 RepID=UPI00082B6E98|nr:TetR/AcrR family transcriptional regulator [Nocardia jejuensis]